MRRWIIVAGVLSLGLLLASAPLVARGAPAADAARGTAAIPSSTAWSEPVRLASGAFFAVAVVFDSGGHAHIAGDGTIAGRSGIWYFTDRTGSWTRQRIMANVGGKAWREPSITFDAHDRIIVAAWRDPNPGLDVGGPSDGIFTVTDRGLPRGTFSAPELLVPGPAAMPTIKAFGTRLAVAYTAWLRTAEPQPPIRFTTWSAGQRITSTVAKRAGSGPPALHLDFAGRPRIAYATPAGVHYASAATTTGDFAITKLPGTGPDDDLPALTIDPDGRPTIAWLHDGGDRDSLRYARQGASWPSPSRVGPAPRFTTALAIDLDSSGALHVLAVGDTVREMTGSGTDFTGETLARVNLPWDGAMRISSSDEEMAVWVTSKGLFMARRSL
jgi:hypothetical protein